MAWTVPGYAAERMLGFGATGEVWAGRDLRSGERVALKRLRAGGTPADRDRLRREAALLAAFEHPHVVRLRGVRGTEDGLVLVLDLAEGGSFAGLLARRGRIGAPEVGVLCAPVAAALVAAHAAGLVHGDVSPGNLLLDARGRPLLADLGTARLAGDPDPAVHGTAGYVDPAVLAGAPPTAASDVYGLAAVAVHLLTGSPPDPLRPLPRDASGLLGQLAACLDPEPSRRLGTAALGAVFEAAGGPDPVPWSALAATEGRPTGGPAAGDSAAGTGGAAAPPGWSAVPGLAETRALPRPAPPAPTERGWWAWAVEPARRWWCRNPAGGGGSWYRSGRNVRRWPRSVRLWPRCRPSRWPRGTSGPAARRVAVVVVAAVAVAGAGAVLSWTGSPRPRAAPVEPGSARSGPARSGPARSGPVAAARDTGAVVTWRDRVQALDAARSIVFARGDPARLRDVYAAGSRAAAEDAAAVAALTAAGAVAPGVRHEVRRLRVLAVTPSRARLEVTDRMPGYRVLDRRGRVLWTVPPRGARTFRIGLVASPSGWRIATVGAVRPGPLSGSSPSAGPRPRSGGGT
jgi:serine/threonine protein kinase